MTHEFQKGAKDHACGVFMLVRSRIDDHKAKFGGKLPREVVLHGPSFEQLVREEAERDGVDPACFPIPLRFMAAFLVETLDDVLISRCMCGDPLASNLLIDYEGNREEL